MQLLIWGTGCTAGVLADRLGRERIAGFVDSFGPEQSFLEKPIYRPERIHKARDALPAQPVCQHTGCAAGSPNQ